MRTLLERPEQRSETQVTGRGQREFDAGQARCSAADQAPR